MWGYGNGFGLIFDEYLDGDWLSDMKKKMKQFKKDSDHNELWIEL